MALMRQVWFDLMSQKEIDVLSVKDLFALLYDYLPDLLYLFTRMSSSNVSNDDHKFFSFHDTAFAVLFKSF